MEKDLVFVIDYGTQSVRVSIIDRHGEFLAFEQERYEKPYFSIKPGYCEQDPNYYYECFRKACLRLTEKNKELLQRVGAISSTCFRDTTAFLDENYKPVRPSILWLDQRQAKLKRKIPSIYTFIYKIIKMNNAIVLNRRRTPALWLQENEMENWKKIKYYAPISSYFNYRLIGVLSDSPSNMTGHYPIDFKKGKRYSKNHIQGCIFGIDPSQLPKITKVGDIIGYTNSKTYFETGIPKDIPFIATGNDKSCEALGAGSIDSSYAHVSYGTASTIAVTSKKYFHPEPFLPAYQCCYKGWYTGEVQIYRGYWMLKRFTEEFGKEENLEAQIQMKAPEEILNQKLSEIPPGSNGLVVQPYWGPGLNRPLAKGSIIGFYDVHTRYHIYRAIIEGIAYALREGLQEIKRKTKKKIKYLTISGGGSKSDAICQITADVFNIPVLKSDSYEASSKGCAMSLFLNLGVYNTLEECKKNMVKIEKKFEPNEENAKKYDYLFKNVYLKIFPALDKTYAKLTKYLQINNEGLIK